MDKSERLFRCNAGMAWVGKFIKSFGGVTTLFKASRIKLLPNGTPDFCGWKSVEITPDMVGKTVAVFLGEEHKATKGDKLRKEQIAVKNIIVKSGGIHREVREDGSVVESGPFD
jgi:hypothetical protein